MKRRDLLRIAGGGIMSGWTFAAPFDETANASEAKTLYVGDFFESDNPEVLAMTERVFDKHRLKVRRSSRE